MNYLFLGMTVMILKTVVMYLSARNFQVITLRVDADRDGNIMRVEDEFINLPDNEWEMPWY